MNVDIPDSLAELSEMLGYRFFAELLEKKRFYRLGYL